MTEAANTWPAPAKLNLFLHITGRRADGYHALQTLFRLLDYGDRLTFVPTRDGRIRQRNARHGIPPEQDLVVRAARLLQAATDCRMGVTIGLDKRLPMGGGLGGGSSDAATTLVALNQLWGTALDQDALASLGLRLGADVPLFVRGHSAWAEGVGEELTPLALPPAWYVVLAPAVHIATGELFGAPELTRDSRPLKISAFHPGDGRNDCQAVVQARYPEVAQALRALGEFGEARMSGTGACVFAEFPREADARDVYRACAEAGWAGFVARGLNRSPLLDRLDLS